MLKNKFKPLRFFIGLIFGLAIGYAVFKLTGNSTLGIIGAAGATFVLSLSFGFSGAEEVPSKSEDYLHHKQDEIKPFE